MNQVFPKFRDEILVYQYKLSHGQKDHYPIIPRLDVIKVNRIVNQQVDVQA